MERRRDGGFTLVEMLAVVVIIAVLAAMVVPRFAGRSEEARRSAASADIQANLAGALDLFELDNGFYPTTAQGLEALRTEPAVAPMPPRWKGPYIKKRGALNDPWGRPYVYAAPGAHNEKDYDLSSSGADGEPDTPDDITNWSGDDPS